MPKSQKQCNQNCRRQLAPYQHCNQNCSQYHQPAHCRCATLFLMCLRPAVTNALTKFQFMKQRYQHRSTGCADHKRCRQCSPKAVIHFLSISKPYSYSCLFFKTNSKRESTCIECEPFKSTMSCDCRRLSKSLAASSRPAHQYALPPKASTAAAIAFASSP